MQQELTVDNVLSVIKTAAFSNRNLVSEKHVEGKVADLLRVHFPAVHQQYNIGGYLGLKVDIDLGGGVVGIELKLFSELTTVSIQRLFGQAIYYNKRVYRGNLIVLIIGDEKNGNTPMINEVASFLKDIGVHYCYLNTIKK